MSPTMQRQFAPDSCRGWSRNVLARIRAQREPVVSPVGAGADYCRPQGVSCEVVSTTSQETLRSPSANPSIDEIAQKRTKEN